MLQSYILCSKFANFKLGIHTLKVNLATLKKIVLNNYCVTE